MEYPEARVLIFAKAPEPGQVKTRLVPAIGGQGAAMLHRNMVMQTVDTVAGAGLAPACLCCAPDTDHPFFQELAGQFGVELQAQGPGDLGARMALATARALAGARAVLLVGTDCPALDAEQLAGALASLENGNQAVVGPAEDGGYVLLGLREYAAWLFEDMPWGSGAVMGLTRDRMRAHGWQWAEQEVKWDIDRPDDLRRLRGSGYGFLMQGLCHDDG